ncbi:hypothetical protein SAMN05443637_10794 [Pseudonocardia thermophila]|uniref:Transmembrane protein n=2 Tax=Pseudonocardia thermophila TaxID=1848 RepID=A0A1M6T1M9_PSETH|nr:hypothetical protein SAMN05443637_10794 [Pseudonocardia thermophila]
MSSAVSVDVIAALAFTWLGMVLAISFLEAPLKFRAPGITTRLGLGIGKLVFRALNAVEVVALVVIVVALVVGAPPAVVVISAVVAGAMLVLQLAAVRPVLNKRTAAVLAGEDAPRSRAHLFYVGLEVVKVVALVVLGIAALAAA